MKPQVLYIDEEPMALRVMGKRLQRAFGPEVTITPILPEATISLMTQKIESFAPLVSVVIDQKLNAAGGPSYVGTELANAIRRMDHKMPIYILTNVADDVNPNLADVEYILSKDDMSDDTQLEAVGARLRRHINVFQDLLSAREVRFEELLRRGYEGPLNKEDEEEFRSLSFQRERQIVVTELLESVDLNKKLDAAEKTLAEIKASLKQ
jgi:hypothetical protein